MGVSWKNEKVVKHFRGIEDTRTYTKSPLKKNSNCVIIHVGTIVLRSSQDPETIVKNIIDMAKNCKDDKNEILISSLVPRLDNLNGKSRQVNIFLKKLCKKNCLCGLL